VLVLDMGEPVKIVEVARRLIAQSGKSISIEYTGLRDGEKRHGVLLGRDEMCCRSIHPLIQHVVVPPVLPKDVKDLLRPMGDAELIASLIRVATMPAEGTP